MPPFFTIITSTYNAEKSLPPLLESLVSQTCRDFNWIVQDGSSSDATMQIVEQYRDRLPEILVDSRKDRGIYDAWNKALDRWQAKLGKWIIFMGAGDTFCHQDSLKEAMYYLEQLSDKYIYYAVPVEIVLGSGEFLNQVSPSDNPSIDLKNGMCLPHQGLFHRHDIFSNNRYDISYSIAGDYDFVCRTDKRQYLFWKNSLYSHAYRGNQLFSRTYGYKRSRVFQNFPEILFQQYPPENYCSLFLLEMHYPDFPYFWGKSGLCLCRYPSHIAKKTSSLVAGTTSSFFAAPTLKAPSCPLYRHGGPYHGTGQAADLAGTADLHGLPHLYHRSKRAWLAGCHVTET